jgi:hypothetical protein
MYFVLTLFVIHAKLLRTVFAGGWQHTVLRGGGPGSMAALLEPVSVWLSSGKLLTLLEIVSAHDG